MADPYIDQYETLGYGGFAVAQMTSLLLGLDPELDEAVKLVAKRVAAATDGMREQLKRAGELNKTTYASAAELAHADPVANARDTLRRAVAYVESRKGGASISAEMLGREVLSTVLRRRPAKLAPALEHASETLQKHQATLPEHAAWLDELRAAEKALTDLNTAVRSARAERRNMTPEVAKARDAWLGTYTSAKRLAEAILGPLGKTYLMPQLFDDLAEPHQVAGVSDAAPQDVVPTPPPS
ncbi:MAG: hypothetical protein HYV07_13270 [Deltaproteobacteria bacterium]|nr:hypothetical protein [Deltaproteobacteria bacterium]